MDNKKFFEILEENPVISSIKSNQGLKEVLNNPCEVVFVLYGNLFTIYEIISKLKQANKIVFLNIDLVEGFSSKEIVVEYIKTNTNIDGILSSKATLLKTAKNLGLLTIHRLFVIDSFSFNNIQKQINISKPTCIELLPGCVPRVIQWTLETIDIPLIAGGLVCEKDDVIAALNAGAIAISTTNQDVWNM